MTLFDKLLMTFEVLMFSTDLILKSISTRFSEYFNCLHVRIIVFCDDLYTESRVRVMSTLCGRAILVVYMYVLFCFAMTYRK